MATEIKDDSAMVVEKREMIDASESIGIRFAPSDPDNPNDWSTWKQYRVLFVALFVSYTSAFNASANGSVSAGFRLDHPDVTKSVFQTTSFTFLAMLGIGPLLTAPVSESFGRRPMLVILTILICLMFLPQALAPNVYSLIFSRLVQGAMGCVEGPVAAGVTADIFPKSSRGIGMGTFVLTIFCANATGPTAMAWVASTLGWHWIYWIQMMMAGLCALLVFLFFPETRGDVILAKRAKQLSRETGKNHYVAGVETAEGWLEALKISCSRPLIYLFTEPIVTALSLYAGFLWGVVFLFVGTIATVFRETYGWSNPVASTVLMCGFIGALIGWINNATIQERFYQKALIAGGGKAKPEVRLYSSAVGAIIFAVSTYCFAWTARPHVHWIVPCIFFTLAQTGIYTVYLATYSYLGDVYERYSSSAQASQGLLRNILGATFPFFGVAMYENLSFPIASTVLGVIATIFAVVPWALIVYGERLRRHSKRAQALERLEGDVLRDEPEQAKVIAV